MPFPPPPPPPPGPPPPPSFPAAPFAASTAASDPNQRNQLLQSIRKGTNLKKTVTNDRSSPIVGGKSGGSGGSGPPSLGSPSSGGSPKAITSGSATLGRNNALAGLFAGGMPKLKPTGLDIGQSKASQSQSLTSLPVANASSLHTKMENTRRQLSIDVKNRGPPPQPPPANQKPTMPQSASDSVLTGQSAVGGRSQSTTSLNQTNGWSSTQLPRKAPVGGYGKPHVAPKPPTVGVANGGGGVASSPSKPCPPPKRPVNGGGGRAGMVARAHSMRAPKSPPIAPVQSAPAFPSPASPASRTVATQPTELTRIGAPPPFHQSQDSLMQTPPPPRAGTLPSQLTRPMGGVASRPMQRPPPPPPSRLAAAVSQSPPCPPPPPPPPTMAPPPPPHRVPSDSSLMANGQPPPPPMRLSSIRNGMPNISGDLESRFAEMFHHSGEFPPPPPFRNLPKSYNSKSVSGKQQAPQPPTHIQLGNRMWSRDNTSTC